MGVAYVAARFRFVSFLVLPTPLHVINFSVVTMPLTSIHVYSNVLCLHRNKEVQQLLRLGKLWSWASTSDVGLLVAKALPVFQAKSLVFTT